ncbi:hypothetical protein [Deinococcus radiotolerans]|uniref:SIR2-like domain-containing protein n=1 Tax=Deinococcus radiotolerans TaxID=1309407 RepID=A0ABQ2FDM7_9DEIO|nr:hypothetical protein [Deinococcus radiotolerans]GGK85675.1 hypothetical protein GCM10010844_00240 [Deinococcus radiotolerans]
MKVFIFGAGASFGYADSKTGLGMPLARNFFETFHKLSISDDRNVLHGFLIHEAARRVGVPLGDADLQTKWAEKYWVKWNLDIEVFATEIERQLSLISSGENNDVMEVMHYTKAYDELIFLFASVMNEIQNGEINQAYLCLARKIDKDDLLITFNWDTMLDRALSATGQWHVDDGYGVQFKKIYRDGWTNPQSLNSKNSLLKLHGSTNWLMPYRTFHLALHERNFANIGVDPKDRILYAYESTKSPYETWEGRYKGGYEPFSYYYYPPNIPIDTPKVSGRSLVSINAMPHLKEYGKVSLNPEMQEAMPLIIPPIQNKEYGILGGILDDIWYKAGKSIITCDEVIFIGYSFPVTDVRSWKMMDDALKFRERPLKITIVNPYPGDLKDRLEERYGDMIEVSVQYMGFTEFISDY